MGNKDTCQGNLIARFKISYWKKNQRKSSLLKLGDSGGPLYDTDSSMIHFVAGVVSYGDNGCGSAGIPQG